MRLEGFPRGSPRDRRPGFTYSDLTQRLVPAAVLRAFPDDALTDAILISVVGGSVGELGQRRGDLFWGEAELPGDVDVFDVAGSALVGQPSW